jgi:predicted small lipoprotein YifL
VAQTLLIRPAALLLATLVLPVAGCGKKGPLYLPEATPAPAARSAAVPAPDAPDRARR